jgi:hypothetical protein
MSLPVRNWARRDDAAKTAIRERAAALRATLRAGGRF